MKTGDILLVHSEGTLPNIIQKFQKRADKEAGYYNHSGIIYKGKAGFYVAEETYIEGYKIKATSKFTPIEKYMDDKHELLLLEYTGKMDEKKFEKILFKYIGIPYDYNSLLRLQIVRLLHGLWLEINKKNTWKKMACHEFVQKVWDEYAGIFPDNRKGAVSTEYRSPYFKHAKI